MRFQSSQWFSGVSFLGVGDFPSRALQFNIDFTMFVYLSDYQLAMSFSLEFVSTGID